MITIQKILNCPSSLCGLNPSEFRPSFFCGLILSVFLSAKISTPCSCRPVFTPPRVLFRGISASYLILSIISLPGLKLTTFFSGTKTSSPVLGLRAFLCLRVFTSNTPKLRSSILPFWISACVIESNVCWTISFVLSCVKPDLSEISLTISFFVTPGPP